MSQPHVLRFALGSAPSATDQTHLERCHEIRRVVFVDEQGVDADLEWDDLDAGAEHFLVLEHRDANARALGTARLRRSGDDAKAERVAVHRDARQRGLGRVLMEAIEARARETGRARVRLNAQVAVIPFYEQLGYRAEGPVFVEAGIDHRAMTLELAPAKEID